MKLHPEYRWTVSDGVLNVFPNSPNNVVRFKGKDPLTLQVSSLTVSGMNSWTALEKLCAAASAPDKGWGGFAGFGNWAPGSTRNIDLNLRDIRLLAAFNAVVKADGRAIWDLDRNSNQHLSCWLYSYPDRNPGEPAPNSRSR